MSSEARPFIFTLTAEEAELITGTRGRGGYQQLQRRLSAQLRDGNLTLRLNDRHLGEVIRYMTRYRGGGFQTRLRRAFQRSLRELINLD